MTRQGGREGTKIRNDLVSKTQPGSKEEPMRKTCIIVAAVAVSMLLIFSFSLAAPWMGYRGSGGWGMGSQYQRMYNPATVETLSGTVESVDKVTPMKGMHSGIHLTLKTDKGNIDVHLGPEWYIERLDTKIEKGDKIEVKGSKVTVAGKPAVIAAEVKKGDSVLVLRDDNGIPAWAGWRR
jgi:hypothetical protein